MNDLHRITIDGREATIVFMTAFDGTITDPDSAQVAVATFDDGGIAYYSQGEPKALGGPGSGNFGHAGRPGEVGGSAPATPTPWKERDITFTVTNQQFRDRMKAKGYRVMTLAELPKGLLDASKAAGAEIVGESPLNEAIVEGFEQGLDEIQRTMPRLSSAIQDHVPIVAVDYPAIDALASASSGPSGSFLMINTAPRVQKFATVKPPAPTIIAQETAFGKEDDDYLRELYKGVVIHESGHIADYMTGDGVTNIMLSTLLNKFHKGGKLVDKNQDAMVDFVKTHLSQYAAHGGPGEASAELFASVITKRPLPKEFDHLKKEILEMGAKKAA